MDKQYRMADDFQLPVKAVLMTEEAEQELAHGEDSGTNYHLEDNSYWLASSEKHINAAARAVNAYDVMQDRIAELEQLNDELHTLVYEGVGLVLSFNNDAVFIDGLGSLPIGTADTVSKQAQRIAELEQERDQLKAQNAGLINEINAVKTDLENGFTICRNCRLQEDTKDLDAVWMLSEIISKSPAACLKEYDIVVLQKLEEKLAEVGYNRPLEFIESYIDTIRHANITE